MRAADTFLGHFGLQNRLFPGCVRMDYSFAALTLGMDHRSLANRNTSPAAPHPSQKTAQLLREKVPEMRFLRPILILMLAAICAMLVSCKQKATPPPQPEARPIGSVIKIKAPLGLPPIPFPADNPPTAETVALGRRLYYDTALSVDNTVSCASCHSPKSGFCDGRRVSTGVHGQQGARNAPTVFNVAYYTTQFWDGRAASLEQQSGGPMANPIEMGHTLAGLEAKLNADASYRADFKK